MNKRISGIVGVALTSLLGLWSLLAFAEPWPPAPFEAQYQLQIDEMLLGTVILRWERPAPDRYRLALTLTPNGAASFLASHEGHEVSEGLILDGRVSPRNYRLDSLQGQAGAEQIRFDPPSLSKHTAQTQVKGREKNLEIPDGTLDRLSQLISLLMAISQDSSVLELPVVERGKLHHYRYHILREGTGRRYRVEQTGKGSEKTTHLEFLAGQVMPESIEQTRDGLHWRLRLSHFRRLQSP
ncbi:MAG: DUF3108 domain-containing protein [Pseudomonadota bacterium]